MKALITSLLIISIILIFQTRIIAQDTGGNVDITAGNGTYTGGNVNILGGSGADSGGDINITSGGGADIIGNIHIKTSSSGNIMGNITIETLASNLAAGSILIKSGDSNIGEGGITLQTGNSDNYASDINLICGSTVDGSSINLTAGGGENGGNINLTPGNGSIGSNGLVIVNGSGTYSGTWTQASDKRFKKNIKPLDNVLSKVKQIDGVRYEFRKNEFSNKNFPDGKQIGVIAQQVEKVFPELVKTDKKGYKSVAYQNMVAVLIESIKEQQKQIDKLNEKVNSLEKEIVNNKIKVSSLNK